MKAVCGWMGGNTGEAPRILATMAKGLPASGHPLTLAAGPAAALLETGFVPAGVAPTDDFHCSITGDFHWVPGEWADLARQRGHRAALAAAWRHHGEQVLQHLRGHFALVILDPERERALLAVDRIGAYPMCYSLSKNSTLVFGSTTDSVLAHPEIGNNLSLQSVYDYFFFHMIPSPETVYTDIRKLEPAQALHFERGKLHLRHYWQPAFNDSGDASFPALQDEFLRTMRSAVQRCDDTQQTGAFLSGGTDSSTVSGMLAGLHPNVARTYSIGFSAEGYDEISYARIAARRFKTRQHEYYVTPQDVVDAIPRIAQAYDEPFGNSSAIPTYYCAHVARQDGTRVMLAGDGGDELFGGNARYATQQVFNYYERVPALLRRGLLEPLFITLPFSRNIPLARKVRGYIQQALTPMPDRTERYNFMVRTDPHSILTADFISAIQLDHPLELLRETWHRAPSTSLLNRMLYLDWKFTLADNDLRKVNRMCALAGVEVRYPMLDQDLLEFSARVPPRMKLKGQHLRWFFKKSLENFLPDEIINKPKHGFGLPFGEWLKTSAPLQDLVYSSLDDFKKRRIVRPEFIDELKATHRSGHASYYGTMLWVFTFLEQWLQQHRLNP